MFFFKQRGDFYFNCLIYLIILIDSSALFNLFNYLYRIGSRSCEISLIHRSSGSRHHNTPLIRFRVPPLCQIGLNTAVKYLLRIRQVALASFHFTYDTRGGRREGDER